MLKGFLLFSLIFDVLLQNLFGTTHQQWLWNGCQYNGMFCQIVSSIMHDRMWNALYPLMIRLYFLHIFCTNVNSLPQSEYWIPFFFLTFFIEILLIRKGNVYVEIICHTHKVQLCNWLVSGDLLGISSFLNF